ncbi:MAG: hypothetical protein M1837_007373 [Sclerophora amabilis]|nr:MAG: hypothetical protein M1837_007373 [Sclerophora amabilis]
MQLRYLALAALAASASAQTMNLTAALQGSPDLSNLTTYVSLFPDLLDSLSSAENITILAPSNDAFATLLEGPMGESIMANDTDLIQAVLTYHVLNGTYASSAIMEEAAFIPTLLNDPMYSNVTGGQRVEAMLVGEDVYIFSGLGANSTVTMPDMNFTGGVIHVIDSVLIPPQNISTTAVVANLTSLAGALINTTLVDALDSAVDITVFAPNNEAFQKIGSALPNLTTDELSSILSYHVVNGTVAYSSMLSNTTIETLGGGEVTITVGEDGSVFVNSAQVILPDVLVANGVVHVIDNVLNPELSTATPDPAAPTQSVAFSGASSADSVPFTSGVPTPTSILGGAAPSPTGGADSEGGGMTSSSTAGAAAAMKTGGVGMAALFGAGAVFVVV